MNVAVLVTLPTLTLLLGLLHAQINAQNESQSSRIFGFLQNRCARNSNNARSFDEIKAGSESLKEYLALSIIRLGVDPESFCEDNRNALKDSMKQLTDAMKPCFSKEEAFIPGFIHDSFSNFLKFLCINDQKNFKIFNSTLGRDCMKKMNQHNAAGQIHDCFNAKLFGSNPTGVIQKQELCNDISTAQRCFSSSITTNCPNFPAFERLNKYFFEAISKPCSGASSTSSPVLLVSFIMILFSYFAIQSLH